MVGSLIGAGASLIGAKISADAAEEAAELQARSAREAIDLEREIFQQSRADLAPFRETGLAALDTLADLFIPGGSQAIQANRDITSLEAQRQGLIDQRNQIASQPPPAPATAAEGIDPSTANLLARLGFSGQLGEAGGLRLNRLTPTVGPDTVGPDTSALDAQIADLDRRIAQTRTAGTAAKTGAAPDLSAFFKSPGFEFRREEGERAIERGLASRGLLNSGRALRDLTEFNSGLASSEFNQFANRLAQLAGVGGDATGLSVNLGQGFAGRTGQTLLDAGTARASGVIGANQALQQGFGNVANAFSTPGFNTNRLFGTTSLTPAQNNALATLARSDVANLPEIF